MARNVTCGQATMTLLEAYGIDTVFGIPGVHTLELYRGLGLTGMRHIQPRHEQGAGFMADGYARVSGKPALCLLITGPGLMNAATPIGQAFSDSMPMLVLSSVNETENLGAGRGRLHEITRQSDAIAPLVAFSTTAMRADQVPEAVGRAFAHFASARPRPVHIEVPLDVLHQPATFKNDPRRPAGRPSPDAAAVAEATRLLAKAKRPVIICGGGVVDHGAAVAGLAERLGAAILLTTAAKGTVPHDHPLCLGSTLSLQPTHAFLAAADVIVAVGTELSETDFWIDRLPIKGKLIRIDIDAENLVRDYPPDVGILADGGATLRAISAELGPGDSADRGFPAAALRTVRAANDATFGPLARKHIKLLGALRDALPDDGHVFSDMTQIAYTANVAFPCRRPRTWAHPVGFGTLGYALPAAIGGQLAAPDRACVAVAGDGGFLFTVQDLGTAVEHKLPIAILLWNNDGLGQIRDDMIRKGIPQIGVSPTNPDYLALAKAFGAKAVRPTSLKGVKAALKKAFKADGPTLIEVRQDAPFLA
ncbi:MAG: 5-guanidino-2-oxopentanoate decarboxylase [Alphaproteobacteria bacterium]|nr:5-guanidino-2-oxopentanoate decarboxylase [Alphaproteobacteria bacterium]